MGAEPSGSRADVRPSSGNERPPPYSAVAGAPPPPPHPRKLSDKELEELTAAFSSLNPPSVATKVDENTCLVHLKLLYAFYNLKEEIGYTDGLWEIYDSRLKWETDGDSKPDAVLSKIREKRWALYVARAVDRYGIWCNTLDSNPLRTEEMLADSPKYGEFTCSNTVKVWTPEMLPPLDVLMVWHSHMLNPHDYLEDCMRAGRCELWAAGLPWNLINDAIDTNFNYKVSGDCSALWEATTFRRWDNTDDAVTKTVKCPACSQKHEIPWTTCGLPEDSKERHPGLVGTGYGDGDFSFACSSCEVIVNRDLLQVAKFVNDVKLLLAQNRPMPGTILDPDTGLPDKISFPSAYQSSITFPNRLIQGYLRSEILELITPNPLLPVNLETVRSKIEIAIQDQTVLKQVEQVTGATARNRFRLPTKARVVVRKMMSRYWGNFSPFALELGGAVIRQGVFTEKMYKIDWLHSPNARETMKRLIVKYQRFIRIMGAEGGKIAVPTLDVDLAWHTHQLSPRSYHDHTLAHTQKLINHDDKISEDTLTVAFEWTSKIYQEMYGEVYSECTCWYCESIRSSHVGSIRRVLGMSKNEKISDEFHDSGRAKLCPPDASAHISAHNAVKFIDDDPRHSRIYEARHKAHLHRLDENYKKAQKRAEKKGRTLPPRDEYYYYWGYPYAMYGPWMYPIYWTPGFYYGGDPGLAIAGSGGAGACAAGTCGGGAGAGACSSGASGVCGTGATCGGGGCGGGGSSGGGGGGCGGGGGGCGGGCGGGGGGCGGGGS